MGFKRTTDGRVFFQGADDDSDVDVAQSNTEQRALSVKEMAIRETIRKHTLQAAETPPRPAPEPPANMADNAPVKTTLDAQATQIQILQLLRGLNTKLQTTQKERNQMREELNSYRKKIQALEERDTAQVENTQAAADIEETRALLRRLEQRTAQNSQNYKTLLGQAEQHKKVSVELSRKQLQLENVQKAQDYEAVLKRLETTEEQQQKLNDQVSEAMSQQARLMRKLEQAMEERARFMRKIERIEETVIHTRDALNAKAMVLLSDQAQEQEDVSRHSLNALPSAAQAASHAQDNTSLWRRSWSFSTPLMLGVCVVAVLGGWFISDVQKPNFPDLRNIDLRALNLPTQGTQQQGAQQDITENFPAKTEQDWIIHEDHSAFLPAEMDDISQEIQQNLEAGNVPENDIGAIDITNQAQLEQLMETKPEVVGKELNKVEPGTPPVAEKVAQSASTQEVPEVSVVTKTPPPAAKVAPKASVQKEKPHYNISRDLGLPKDIRVIEEDAFAGVPEAQHDLAAIYTAGHGGVRQNYQKAAYWFEHAAKGGIGNAAYNLGVLYHQGLGVEQSIDQAMRWYKEAAKLHHPEAQYNLGIAHIEGIGVEYDPVKAANYFEESANQGVTEAAYNLGLIYENGLLGMVKPEEALRWYKEAADKGSPEAKAALTHLAKALNISVEEVSRIAKNARTFSTGADYQPPASGAQAQPEKPLKNLTAQVQEFLGRAGLYTGKVDGRIGNMTRDAVNSYQAIHNIPITGEIDADLLQHMLANENSPLLGEQNAAAN